MNDTPMMKQYMGFKKQYPGKIVLFRMGDFFETFGEDAKTTSSVLNITLTKRDKSKNAVPLAGFPHKAMDQYLPKLVEAGHCVVVVDQLEDPKLAKGIVKRGVTRIVTPGTLDGDQADDVKDAYLMSIYSEKGGVNIALCDMSNGKFFFLSGKGGNDIVNNTISAYDPVEILLIEGSEDFNLGNIPIQFVEKSLRNKEYASDIVTKFFEIKNTNSIDIETESSEILPVAMIIKYISETQLMNPKHIMRPQRINIKRKMMLDKSTIRNLELVTNSYTGDISGSLFSVLDNTNTKMGRRLLYSWVLNPLITKSEIDDRLNTVEKLHNSPTILEQVREELKNVSDIERIVGKIGLGRVNARDIKALEYSLSSSLAVLDTLSKELKIKYKNLDSKFFQSIVKKISETITEDPPLAITEGNIILEGYSKEVDELRKISGDSKSWIKEFEDQEKERTGISSLKIGYNRVFGYYIEITKTHMEKVPDTYIRKQTLVNSERYITEELKEKEDIILNAQEKLLSLEYEIFQDFRDSLLPNLSKLQEISQVIAQIDVLSGFADVARHSNYVKPEVYEMGEKDGIIKFVDGRHPVVEKISGEEFISNDTELNLKDSSMAILTGPNMSGKSTYIRQVAIITLMAQIGSFVPAKEAKISITDRVFTRVGASDDLARGRSTFMVEMDEAANIINNATKYSLIVLDEVGRGTSTYDGVSIAWALSEYIVKEVKARTLFATHYHELLKLSEQYTSAVKNYNVLVEEDLDEGTVIFLRKIVEGGTDRSYGIYVAKMAGLPEKVIKRANEILENFEQKQMFSEDGQLRDSPIPSSGSDGKDKKITNGFQYPLFTAKESEVEREIQDIDIDNITPLEALNKIVQWKKKV